MPPVVRPRPVSRHEEADRAEGRHLWQHRLDAPLNLDESLRSKVRQDVGFAPTQ